MSNNIIKLVRGDDGSFLNQVFLIVHYKTNLNLDGYKTRLTIENPTNFIKTFEVHNNATEIDLDKTISSTLQVGTHRCNIKLIDTLNRIKTVKNFEIQIEDEFYTEYVYPNEYELEIILDDGINKYKNYNELFNKPSIQGIELQGDKSFQDLGIDKFTIGISNEGIYRHNKDKNAHFDIREQIFNKQDRLIAGSNITIVNGIISALGAQGGVTTDYKELGNKPIVNNVVLDGELSLDELGIQAKGEYVTEQTLDSKGYLTNVPTGYITEEELEAYNYLQEVPEEYYTDAQNQEIYATIEEVNLKQDLLTAGENINIQKSEDETETIISASIPENYITQEKLQEYNFTTGDVLQDKLNTKQNILLAGNNIRLSRNLDGTYTISAIDSKNPSEIVSYNALNNKPTINNILLSGNKSLQELGIQPTGEYQNKLKVGENISIEDDVISAIMPDDMCTDGELAVGLSTKADKATTLEGYNIQDAYTKDNVDNLLTNKINHIFTDVILQAPNGVAKYTEKSITVKSGLDILFINGENKTVENDIEMDFSTIEYSDKYNKFYLILQYENSGDLQARIISQSEIKTMFVEKIPNTTTGYVKNLYTNRYYFMEYQGNGIYLPVLKYMKIIGEGSMISDGGLVKIQSFTPYNVLNGIKLDDILLQLKELQYKLTFGQNFEVNNNVVEYKIPYNYVTKEYLIENDYATQTNINDAVNNHNINSNSHQDIRNLINNLNISYSNLSSRLNSLNSKIDSLTHRVEVLEQKVRI